MKKFLVFLLAVCALYLAGRSGLINLGQVGDWLGLGRNPAAITDPVYSVMRFRAQFHDSSLDMVAYAKAFDQADCERFASDEVSRMQGGQHRDGELDWGLVSSECKSALDSRSAKLFDNQPTFANYVSASPGSSSEREIRLIFWGVTAQEGATICDEVPQVKQNWDGQVTCVPALSGQ